MRRTLLAIVAILFLAITAAVTFRTALLELALRQGLAAVGFADVALRVARVDFASTEISDIDLGGDLHIGALKLVYAPAELLRLRLRRIVVDAPVVDLSAEKGSGIEVLRALSPESSSGSTRSPTLPPIEVRNGRVRWISPLGELIVSAGGELVPGRGGALRAAFELTALADAGRLQGELAFARDAAGAATGTFRLARGSLRLGDLALNDASANWSFAFDGRRLTGLEGEIELPRMALAGKSIGTARWRGRFAEARFSLRGEGTILEAPFALRLEGLPDVTDWRLRLSRLAASLEAAGDAALLTALDLPTLAAGRARLRLVGGDIDLPLAAMASAPSEVLQLLLASGATASATLDLDEVTIAAGVDGLSATIGLDLEAGPGVLHIRPVLPAIAEAERLAPALLEGLGLPSALAAQLSGPWTLDLDPVPEQTFAARLTLTGTSPRLEAGGALAFGLGLADRAAITAVVTANWPRLANFVPATASFRNLKVQANAITVGGAELSDLIALGELAWSEDRLTGRIDASARLGPLVRDDWQIGAMSIFFPLDLALGREGLTLSATGGGHLQLQRPEAGGGLTLPDRLDFRLGAGNGPLLQTRFDGRHDFETSFSLEAETPIDLELAFEETTIPAALGPFSLRLDAAVSPQGLRRLKGRLSDARLVLPKHHLSAEAIGADLTLGESGARGQATFEIANIVTSDPELPLAPLTASGRLTLAPEGIEFTVRLADLAAVARIDAKGRYDPGAASLAADIRLPETTFQRDGPQPRDLTPLADGLGEITGTISAEASLTLADSALDGTGWVLLDELSLATEDISLDGASGRLRFTSLWPPTTAPEQRLRIRSLESAVKVNDIDMTLAVVADADAPFGRLRIDSATGETDFGRISIAEAVIDPLAGRHRLRLAVEELSLAELLKLADIEGLEVTGQLSGEVPISVSDGKLVIAPSTLEASGPGAIRFTSEAARRALTSGGEQVELLLEALENFQYESLSLGLEKSADGGAKATLAIRGHNPEVLDGYPFAVYIDLSGDFESLFATAMDAYRLSDRAIRATVR